jgi:hypothetical protein
MAPDMSTIISAAIASLFVPCGVVLDKLFDFDRVEAARLERRTGADGGRRRDLRFFDRGF